MANRYANLDGTKQIKDEFSKINTGFDNVEDDVDAHLADLVTDSGGVHGLAVESGNWTPAIVGLTTPGTNTYTVQTGTYYRIGKLVYIFFTIRLSAKDVAMAGALAITGLPFTTVLEASPVFGRVEGVTLNVLYDKVGGYASSSQIVLIQQRGTWDNIDDADITDSAVFIGTMSYLVA